MGCLNLCRSCGCDFASLSAFDRHRLGTHQHTHEQGLELGLPQEDGRRCLDESEKLDAGMGAEPGGRWSIVADADRAWRGFAKAERPRRRKGRTSRVAALSFP